MAKLPLRELSTAMGDKVPYSTLLKYEKGKMMPNSEVLAALCKVLNQPADFFFRSVRMKMEIIH